MILAILAVVAGICQIVFAGIINFRNPKYKIDTYIVYLMGSAAFYIVIPLSSIYLICKILINEQSQTPNSSTTAEEYRSTHTINHATSTGTSTSRRHCTIKNLKR
jgi:hypothetical protein